MDQKPPSPPDSAPRAFYEDMSERHLDPHTVRGITYRNLMVARQLTARDRKVLEIGPGEGWLTRHLGARGHEVVAVDLARGWLAALEDHRPGASVQAEMTRLPFRNAGFNAVIAAEVVEHIADLSGALGEAARVLAPRGRLIVTVPYRETLQYLTHPHSGVRYERNGHVHTFDEDSLAASLSEAGLEPETRFVGPTRFSREILRRAPIAPLLPLLNAIDRATLRSQRVSDTWMLMTARRR